MLLAAVSIKYWSTMRLWNRYRPEEYTALPEARRLYLAGKITPVCATAALVILHYCTGLLWLEIPAWCIFGVITAGVFRIVRKRFQT